MLTIHMSIGRRIPPSKIRAVLEDGLSIGRISERRRSVASPLVNRVVVNPDSAITILQTDSYANGCHFNQLSLCIPQSRQYSSHWARRPRGRDGT
jgi:hypothetical protein